MLCHREVFMLKKTKRMWAGVLVGLLIIGSLSAFPMEAQAKSYGENIIVNPNFADSDLSAWSVAQGNATITAVTGENEIVDGITTYGQISDRTAPYECFAPDITAVVENGKEYEYSFFSGVLTVSKIYGSKKRKELTRLHLRDLSAVLPMNEETLPRAEAYGATERIFTASCPTASHLFIALWEDRDTKKRSMLTLELNEKAVKIIKYYNMSAMAK